MADRMFERPDVPDRDRDKSVEMSAQGSMGAAILGIGAIVLCILGLVGVLPATFAAISVIAIGVALVMEGGASATRYQQVVDSYGEERAAHVGLLGGMSSEVFAGIASIALGILALLRVHPLILMPSAVILAGASLFLSAGSAANLNMALLGMGGRDRSDRTSMLTEGATLTSGGKVLAGLAVTAVGIIALREGVRLGDSVANVNLTLAALLSLGGSVLLSGSVFAGRVFGTTRRRTRHIERERRAA